MCSRYKLAGADAPKEKVSLKNFYGNPPASVFSLQRFEKVSGFKLPEDYQLFLQGTNGGEGYLNANQYAILWRLEDLLQMNESYQVPEYAPGLFAFGSNGGGEALAFDKRSKEQPIVRVPFVGMDLSLVEIIAQRFKELINQSLIELVPDSIATNRPRGREIFEVQPIILGGSPTDRANKTVLSPEDHIAAVTYWNRVIRDLRRQT